MGILTVLIWEVLLIPDNVMYKYYINFTVFSRWVPLKWQYTFKQFINIPHVWTRVAPRKPLNSSTFEDKIEFWRTSNNMVTSDDVMNNHQAKLTRDVTIIPKMAMMEVTVIVNF